MVMKEEFEILISKDGKMKMTARGFKGKQCEKPLQQLKQLLAPDSPVLEQGHTWEYYLAEEDVTESLKVSQNPDKDRSGNAGYRSLSALNSSLYFPVAYKAGGRS